MILHLESFDPQLAVVPATSTSSGARKRTVDDAASISWVGAAITSAATIEPSAANRSSATATPTPTTARAPRSPRRPAACGTK